jgi:allantoinase
MSAAQLQARQRGLDHQMFPFRTLTEDSPFKLPNAARVGLALIVVLQRFHLDDAKAPFPVPGTLDRPYPDVGNATQREVALRSGLWRIIEGIEEFGLRASFVVEQDALPLLGDRIGVLSSDRCDVVAGGRHATLLHTSAMKVEDERRIIRECRDALQQKLGRSIKGWRSPYCSQSPVTLDLLAEEGFTYCGDFNNDDRPYLIATKATPLVSIPMHHFSSDLHSIFVMKQPPEAYFSGMRKGAEWLLKQSKSQQIMLPLVIHPWIMGAPHRYREYRRMLQDLMQMDGLTAIGVEQAASAYETGPHS